MLNLALFHNSSDLLTFLIDSGSDVSLIREQYLGQVEGLRDDRIRDCEFKLNGAGGVITPSGKIDLRLDIGGDVYQHTFLIVTDHLPLNISGIIGRDFFEEIWRCTGFW